MRSLINTVVKAVTQEDIVNVRPIPGLNPVLPIAVIYNSQDEVRVALHVIDRMFKGRLKTKPIKVPNRFGILYYVDAIPKPEELEQLIADAQTAERSINETN